MKLKIVASFLTSLIITIVIFFFSQIYLLKNYSSSIEIKINPLVFTALSINIPFIENYQNLNNFLLNRNRNYINEVLFNDYTIDKANKYFLINNNDRCKVPRKFNKIPVSVIIKDSNSNIDTTIIISYLIYDPANVKICNNEINNLLNKKIKEELFNIKTIINDYLNFYYSDKIYLDNYFKSNKFSDLSIQQNEFNNIYYVYSKLKKAEELLKNKDYFEIKRTISKKNVISQNEIFIYFFLIFILLLVLIYSALSGITKNYYKKIKKYINY